MNPRYKIVAVRARHRCEYCGAPERVFNFPFEVEHIWPRARAGADEFDNLALACRACNLFKGLRTTGFDEMLEVEIELFNPRRDTWVEHFQVDKETGVIVGLTNIGRATVNCLQMNWVRLFFDDAKSPCFGAILQIIEKQFCCFSRHNASR